MYCSICGAEISWADAVCVNTVQTEVMEDLDHLRLCPVCGKWFIEMVKVRMKQFGRG